MPFTATPMTATLEGLFADGAWPTALPAAPAQEPTRREPVTEPASDAYARQLDRRSLRFGNLPQPAPRPA